MPQAKVVGPLKIDGEDVKEGSVVELDEAPFQNLLRKGKILPVEDPEPEPDDRESDLKVSKRKKH